LEVSTTLTRFAQQGGFAHARAAQDKQGFAGFDNILNDIHRAINSPPDPAGQTDNMPAPVAQAGDAMQGAFETGAVIGIKLTDPLDHVVQFGTRDFLIDQDLFALNIARRWDAPQVQDDLQQVIVIIGFVDGFDDIPGQYTQQGIQVISYS
jgi:hypothetical protein